MTGNTTDRPNKRPAVVAPLERHVRPRSANANGWLEAAIAWEVCASIHESFAKGKDALYKTRHGDFVEHADDARRKAQSDDGTLLRAADMLTAYAELIRRDGATHVEEHHYLPDVEFIAAELRARAVCVA
jgi:hypothetical protein